MFNNKRILALIPARGGSKGLPGKNIIPINGRPLIAWTIEQALKSKYIDRVIVSTDDPEISIVARDYGADVPFLRPKALSRDKSKSIDVITHSLKFLSGKGEVFDYLLLLEPTSPLRDVSDIDKCIEILVNHKKAKAIVSVAEHEGTHPKFSVNVDKKSGFINSLFGKKIVSLRRQELDSSYYFDGTIYLSEVDALLKTGTFYHGFTLPYIVPRWKAVEIDELSDLVCAEALLKSKYLFKGKN